MKKILLLISFFIPTLVWFGCTDQSVPKKSVVGNKVFREVSKESSGMVFNNKVVESNEVNYYKYVYLYNGGGVGIGDINNDDLPDVYLTSTMGTDKLFLNKGNLQFEDISAKAGINKYSGYKTGVTMVDINSDGWLDIYVCRAGWSTNPKERENLFFINQKDGTFAESAVNYQLNSSDKSIQSSFFDYDNDGDLDMYLSNHPQMFEQPLGQMKARLDKKDPVDSDRLYRNEGNGKFTEVGQQAGIANYGYGLGLLTKDLNNDGLTDIYVTSDFMPADSYFINNGDGTFTESLKDYFPHCSYFAMGVDAVDINNDKNLDLFVGEMLSEDNTRQKTQMAPMDMARFAYMVNNGMHFQYMRNSFNINNGNGHFSDVAHFSGIDKTDWSWSCLFGDYDNDGDNDLLVANGWLKDTQDKDFSKKSNELAAKNSNRLTFDQVSTLLKSTRLRNYAFRYDGDLKFEKVSSDWGFDFNGFSSGMAYGDLDRDGDLDVIVNNMNDNVSLYENTTNSSDFIAFRLNGPKENPQGLNAKITLQTSKGIQYKEFQVTRGFQASCDPIIHFGLAPNETPQSVDIQWNRKESQKIEGLEKGKYHTIDYAPTGTPQKRKNPNHFFASANDNAGLNFKHVDQYHDDYKTEVLLPHLLSQLGPALAKADVNGDGLEDIYTGGAKGQSGVLWTQNRSGKFTKNLLPVFLKDQGQEDIDALFFDADGDKDQDLYVVSGSNEFIGNPSMLKDRLYLNDGKGNFTKDSKLLPAISSSGGAVRAADFDKDGDMDLFVGGRLVQGKYPNSPDSYLLENTPEGFKDITASMAPDLAKAGMIKTAVWTDFNNDDQLDLIVAGEWTNILFFENQKGKLVPFSKQYLPKELVGWWNSIHAADLDNDGDTDYVLGNLGLNYKYQASDERPFEIYAADFDKNGQQDIVLGYYSGADLFPVRGLQCSSEQIPDIKKKFPTYEGFGKANLSDIYGEELSDALHYEANCFSSLILKNEGGKFTIEYLPTAAQLAPIQDCILDDFDNDGDVDILAAGNWFVSEIETPRADNGTGVFLKNKGDGTFESLSCMESGFFAKNDVRKMVYLKRGGSLKDLILVANNNNFLEVFESKGAPSM